MSKKLTIIFFILVAGLALSASQFFSGKIMKPNEVKKKWGHAEVDYQKFKTSDVETRSKMAYGIITDKSLIGIDVEEVRSKFGAPDGYYFIDSYPAYLIQKGKSRSEETWQIVFLLNEKYKIRDVIIHKNCCEK